MRLIVLIFAILCLWLKLAMGVIQDGYLKFTPNGAVSYSVWRANPGVTQPQYVATITTNSYPLGVVQDGTRIWVKANFLSGGFCCIESDFGFAVTEPQVEGTNTIRIIYARPLKILQGADTASGPWVDLAELTNPPVQLTTQQRQLFRLKMLTNAPPLP